MRTTTLPLRPTITSSPIMVSVRLWAAALVLILVMASAIDSREENSSSISLMISMALITAQELRVHK
jgi:hypothetical protein